MFSFTSLLVTDFAISWQYVQILQQQGYHLRVTELIGEEERGNHQIHVQPLHKVCLLSIISNLSVKFI